MQIYSFSFTETKNIEKFVFKVPKKKTKNAKDSII